MTRYVEVFSGTEVDAFVIHKDDLPNKVMEEIGNKFLMSDEGELYLFDPDGITKVQDEDYLVVSENGDFKVMSPYEFNVAYEKES